MTRILPPRFSRAAARAAAGFAFGTLLLLPVPVAAAQDEAVTASTRAESWYRPLPVLPTGVPDICDLPTGCIPEAPAPPAQPPSPYAPGTLHVGVSSGVEESRTYVALDLSGVASDADVTGGTITLPIATDPTAGTVQADVAKVRACNGPAFVADGIDGNIVGAPAPDCSISSPATYVAAEGEQPPALVIDLAPFADVWSGTIATLAILPEEGLLPTEQWHVAFHRRDSSAPDAAPISARLELSGGQGEDDEDVALPATTFDDESPTFVPDNSFAAPALDLDSIDVPAAEAPAVDQPAPQPTMQPVVSVLDDRFAYPVVFLLPFLIGAVVAWTGRAFTRDLRGSLT